MAPLGDRARKQLGKNSYSRLMKNRKKRGSGGGFWRNFSIGSQVFWVRATLRFRVWLATRRVRNEIRLCRLKNHGLFNEGKILTFQDPVPDSPVDYYMLEMLEDVLDRESVRRLRQYEQRRSLRQPSPMKPLSAAEVVVHPKYIELLAYLEEERFCIQILSRRTRREAEHHTLYISMTGWGPEEPGYTPAPLDIPPEPKSRRSQKQPSRARRGGARRRRKIEIE